MTDISVPGLGTQTPLLADSVPGVRNSTGLLDCRFTLTALRTLMQSGLATVAATGAYADLSGKPTLGNVSTLTYAGSGTQYLKSTGAFAAVAYSEVSGTPTLAAVATSGVYSDLTGKPTLGTLAALSYPSTTTTYLRGDGTFATLATVGSTGAYSDLTGKPTLGTVAALSYPANTTTYLRGDGTFVVIPYASLSGLPTLGTVAALNYPGGTTTFLRADGTFTAPAGGGDVVGPAGAVNGKVAIFSGTTGKLIADSGVTLGSLASQSGTFSGTSSGTNTGDQTTISGNAGSATVLATARAINGVNFDGSAAITVPPRITIQAVTSAGTVTPTFANDQVNITAQAAALILANPTGTAVDGAGISIRIKDNGTARAITYGTQYRALGVTLPTTTVASKTLYLGMIFNNADTKWDVVAVAQEA